MDRKCKTRILQIVFLSLLLLISPAMAEQTTNDTWHQFHKDATHTGYQVAGPYTNHLAWSSDSVNAIGSSSVAIAEGKVFVNCHEPVSDRTWIKALNLSNGSVVWSTEIDDMDWGSWASPAYNNSCVFTSTGEETTCLYANNGSVKWIFENPTGQSSCNGGPSIADGKVFCSDWDGGHYYCLYETNGTEIWNFTIYGYESNGDYSLNSPKAQGCAAYKDGWVYLTSFNYQNVINGSNAQGFVYCVDPDTGVERWRTVLAQNGCGSVACGDDGRVYVSTYNFYSDGATYALDAANGSVIWEKTTLRTDSTPALAYGNVYVAGGYYGSKTYCFNASNGTTLWETDKSMGVGYWTESLAIADGKVYTGVVSPSSGMIYGYGTLRALDAFTGETLWSGDRGGASPAIYDGKLITIDSSCIVCCYDGSNPCIDFEPEAPELETIALYTDTLNVITATVNNIGTIYCGNDVKVSLLDEFDGDIVEISNQTIETIPGGMSETLTFTWAPTDVETGVHRLYVQVDPENSIGESNEGNNILPRTVSVLSGECDLQPESITPSEVYVNNTYLMTVTVDNIGFKNSNACKVTVKQGSSIITNITLPVVSPGMSNDINFTWTPVTSGDITLSIVVDADGETEENNVTNNELEALVRVMPETAIETLSDDDWTQFQNGWTNSGATGAYVPTDSSASLEWSANFSGECVDCPPIVVEDMVYSYTSNGTLYACSQSDGSIVWRKGLDPTTIQSCTPAYGDGNIFVASNTGNLSAYDVETAELQWSIKATDEGFESPVTYYDHRIYIGDGLSSGVSTKYFHCYDDLGNHLWSYPNPDCAGFLWNGATVVGNYVVYPTHEGKMICLDRKNGTLIDEISLDSGVGSRISFANETPGIFRSSIVYNDGYVYATSEQGQSWGFLWKVGFNSSSGVFQNDGWSLMQGFSTSTPVICDGRVYVGQGEHGDPGKLNCVNDYTGELIWSYDVPGGVKSSPVVSTYYSNKPFVYFTSAMDNGSLYCLDVDGNLIWEYNPPDDDKYVLQGAAVSQGKVYYGTDDGYLYCIEGDWNPFNDEFSASGDLVSRLEVQSGLLYWKKQIPLANGHVLSRIETQTLLLHWKKQIPM